MKNLQYVRQAQYKKGFIMPLLVAIIAVLVIGGGVYVYKNKRMEAPSVGITETQDANDKNELEGTDAFKPVISSITPASGAVGTGVEIRGTDLNGFEGETYLYFFKANGESGSISANSYLPAGATTLKFNVPDKMCTKNMGASDLPCPSFMTVTPGSYRIYALPWGDKSNEVQFTVTN